MVKQEGGQRQGCAELQSFDSVLPTMQHQGEEERVLARTLSPLDKALPAKRTPRKQGGQEESKAELVSF